MEIDQNTAAAPTSVVSSAPKPIRVDEILAQYFTKNINNEALAGNESEPKTNDNEEAKKSKKHKKNKKKSKRKHKDDDDRSHKKLKSDDNNSRHKSSRHSRHDDLEQDNKHSRHHKQGDLQDDKHSRHMQDNLQEDKHKTSRHKQDDKKHKSSRHKQDDEKGDSKSHRRHKKMCIKHNPPAVKSSVVPVAVQHSLEMEELTTLQVTVENIKAQLAATETEFSKESTENKDIAMTEQPPENKETIQDEALQSLEKTKDELLQSLEAIMDEPPQSIEAIKEETPIENKDKIIQANDPKTDVILPQAIEAIKSGDKAALDSPLEDGEVMDSDEEKSKSTDGSVAEAEKPVVEGDTKPVVDGNKQADAEMTKIKKKSKHKHKKKKKVKSKDKSRSVTPDKRKKNSDRSSSDHRRNYPVHNSRSHSSSYRRTQTRFQYFVCSCFLKSKKSSNFFRPSSNPSQRKRINDLREKIDKKRLLVIARKNVLHMIEKGTLPSSLSSHPLAQQQLVTLKAGGKSVEELTEFCKGLAGNKDYISDSSDDEKRALSDEDGDKPFINHPFKLKDPQPPIRMNIPNSVQLPIRSPSDPNKLRQIFPVSSGNQHRELEWVPVEKPDVAVAKKSKEPKAIMPPPPPAPVVEAAVLMPPPPPPPGTTSVVIPAIMPVPPVEDPTPKPALITNQTSALSSLAPPTSAADVSSIVAKRLNAVRKLQENPLDMQAMMQMYQAQKQMKQWAESKLLPGQFGVGPGTRLLTPSELSGPSQVWAKRNQLINAAPLGDGIGMNLLKKMGWNPGEGLGKNKEGSLIPLMLDVKMDKKGLVSNTDHGQRIARAVPVKIRQDLSGKHPVSALMELCSKRKWGPPDYTLLDEGGPAHKKNFLYKVRVKGVEYQPSVSSPNKKNAKALAAQVCLQTLGLVPRDLNSAI